MVQSHSNSNHQNVIIQINFFFRHDAKTVNAISLGLFSKNTKIVTATLKFFLDATTKKTADGSDEEDEKEEKEEAKKERVIIFLNPRIFFSL
jgi:hypothetical protein